MNKELEEAIKKALTTKQRGICTISTEILEKALNYIENSIPKEKIKEQKKLHTDYLLNQAVTSNPTLDAHFRDTERCIINTLQDILEEK